MSNIVFDICPDAHVMSDIGGEHLASPGQHRVHNNNAECYAQLDGRACMRQGRCVICRENRTWRRVTKKTFVCTASPTVRKPHTNSGDAQS